jgi:hypothetical protein
MVRDGNGEREKRDILMLSVDEGALCALEKSVTGSY